MNPLHKLSALLPARLARYAVPLAILVVATLVFAGLAVAALVSPGSVGISAARISETRDIPDTLQAQGLSERDTDKDGLSDSLENYLYGTDVDDWNSSGLGIPDGWLVQHRFDPLSPLTLDARGAAPPADKLPAAYADGYPLAYTPLLSVYYAYGKPADYKPGEDAPWWRAGPHADASDWDQAGKGIPTGWLLHHGLDPQDVEPDRVAPGSKGNLTIRQAFEHDTSPLKLDSDDDGLGDWAEINVHKTSPARFSTAGTGIADGWLVRFGLNPFDASVSTQDPDLDGLTNLEEFHVGYDAFRSEIAQSGIEVLYRRGLDPLEWDTAHTGIPDGWYVRYGLSAFGADAERVIARSAEFPEIKTYAPAGSPPLPDVNMTVRDAYAYGRPSDWNESSRGVWWGGTDPATGDTDNDGLPDVIEIRGWYNNVTTDVGPDAKAKAYLATSNPLESDSDGDGLKDIDEYRGRVECRPQELRAFTPTDPRARDTAFSGLTDLEKVCGATRGSVTYDFGKTGQQPGATLDPTKADSAGDYLHDGARLDFWDARYQSLKANPRYPYEHSAYRTVFEWTEKYSRFSGLSREATLAEFRPDGDVDGDGVANVLDRDASGGLFAEKFARAGTDKATVFFPTGPKIDPTLYRFTEFASPVPHPAADPANPDTDGDSLPDAWEIRFGTYDPLIPGWNLDPTKADSDRTTARPEGNGVTDDKENNDGDSVTWYAYKRSGSGTERLAPNVFEFGNALEYLAGTDPNEGSTLQDGVPDGWKAFWGSRVTDETYPNLLASRDPRVGEVALERASEIEAAIASSPIAPLADLKGQGSKSTGYVRIVTYTPPCAPDGAEFRAYLRTPDEFFPANPCYGEHGEHNLNGTPVKLVRIMGVSTLTYKKEAELRTNPFLADTDGDAAPDAYESYYALRSPGGTLSPDPTLYDGAKDPDNDGIGVTDECKSNDGGRTCGVEIIVLPTGDAFGAGADPNDPDTDDDGILDGIEIGSYNPLDPSDEPLFEDVNRDSDGDKVADYLELTGWGKTLFDTPVKTDPQDADTDNDALLDGETQQLTYTKGASTPANALIESWCARGIAHTTTFTDASRTRATGVANVCGPGMGSRVTRDLIVTFIGEGTVGKPFGLRPDAFSTGGDELPDGWLAYYQKKASDADFDAGAYLSAYKTNRPAWWTEAKHGVWWWGRAPGVAGDDLDRDGMNDATDADPFPGTLRLDAYTYGATTLRDPRLLPAFVAAAPTPADMRLRAQAVGDGAGDPAGARAAAESAANPNGVLARIDRAPTAIVDLALQNGTIITKGIPFQVTGRVVLDARTAGGALIEGSASERVGVAHRPVVIGFFSPAAGNAIGLAFTDADGRFNASVNISSAYPMVVPANETYGGVTNATLAGRFDPSALQPGNLTAGVRNSVTAWTLNTSSTLAPTETSYGSYQAFLPDVNGTRAIRTTHATNFSAAAPIPITVRAETRLTTTVGETVENGATLVGDVKLADASGAVLADRQVRLRWTGAETPIDLLNLSTDRDGVVNITNLDLRASVPRPDQYALIATFTSTDANLGGSASAFPVAVLSPTRITGTVDREAVTVGDPLLVQGTLATRSVTLGSGHATATAGVANAQVRISMGGTDTLVRTDDKGGYSARVTVPGSLAAGPTIVSVRYAGSGSESPAEGSIPLAVKRTAEITSLTTLEGPRSISVTLRGKLVDNLGQGFEGPILVDVAGGKVANGTADEKGIFAISVPLDRLQLGAQTLRVAFPGDAGHAPGQNFTQARVTSTTTITLAGVPATVIRGTPMTIHARILDDEGRPVVGQAIAYSWRGERVAVLVSDADGFIAALVSTNATERPAPAALGFEYLPQPTSVYQSASAAATVRVLQGVDLDFPVGALARGHVSLTGRLFDDEGRPIPAAPIRLSMAGKPFGEARTSRNGSFELVTTLPRDHALGAVTMNATYDGTSVLAGAIIENTWHVRSPLIPQLTALGPFVRGESAPVEGAILDDAGKGVDATLRAVLAGRDIGPVRVVGGVVKTALLVPTDLERGETTLVLRVNGTDKYDAFEKTYPVVLKIRPKVDVQLPALAIRGFSFGGDVIVRDDKGQPLRNTSFAYVLGKGGSAVTGQTDADGRASIAATAPLSGDVTLSLTVRGGPDVLAADYKTPTLRVVGPATPLGYATLVIAVLVVLALVALFVVAALVRRRQLEEVRDILEETIRDLLAGNEYAGTVFLAYRRLSAFLSKNGYAEQASQTPREFAVGVRKALPLGAIPLRELIRLFEEARYSDHAIGSRERDGAVENLSLVRSELDRILGRKEASA